MLYILAEAKEDARRVREATMDMFTGKRAETTMDEIFKMNKSFERSKEKALNRKRLRMASEMDF